jgi:hypothetical protein
MKGRRRGGEPPHGAPTRYKNRGCRCWPCRKAGSLARAGQAGNDKVDATATVRKVRALLAYGVPFAEQARELGCAGTTWPSLLARDRTMPKQVLRKTHDDIDRIYRELTEQMPPRGGHADQARTLAAARGWHGPEAWTDATIGDPDAEPFSWLAEVQSDDVDEVRVERAIAGRCRWGDLKGYPADRTEIIRRLHGQGVSDTTIARLLRCNTTAIRDWREKYGLTREGIFT